MVGWDGRMVSSVLWGIDEVVPWWVVSRDRSPQVNPNLSHTKITFCSFHPYLYPRAGFSIFLNPNFLFIIVCFTMNSLSPLFSYQYLASPFLSVKYRQPPASLLLHSCTLCMPTIPRCGIYLLPILCLALHPVHVFPSPCLGALPTLPDADVRPSHVSPG